MDTLQTFPFKIGQDAESKSHTDGYRGAWFRCKVRNISTRGGELWCALEYFDFPGEKVTWTKVYQKDLANKKKLELMMRPGFPYFCRECEITDCHNNAEIAAIINNKWQVGNLVDWWYDSCFWSGKIAAVHDSIVQVDLLEPPNGEGGSYEADCKDLRPTLSWSIESGWIVPSEKGTKDFNPCVWLKGDCNSTSLMSVSGACSHLTECIQLDGERNSKTHIWNPEQVNLRVGIPNRDLHMTEALMDKDATEHKRKTISIDNSLPDIAKTDINQSMLYNSLPRKRRNSFSLSTFKKEQAKVIVDRAKSFCHVRGRLKQKNLVGGNNCSVSVSNEFDMPYNSRNKKFKRNSCRDSDEIESSVMVLEELANKVKWLKGVIQFGFKQQSVMTGLAWQFAENQMTNKEVN